MSFLKLFCLVLLSIQIGCTGKSDSPLMAKSLSKEERSQKEAFAKNYMISTQGKASTLAAKKMFEMGGNAFDAAAAATFAISVERPQSTGIGGGGFMLVHDPKSGKNTAYDFRESAPARAHEKMYQDNSGNVVKGMSRDGVFAVGVPGLVAGILEIHAKHGKLTRQQVIQPAIDLARDGFPVYPHLKKSLDFRKDVMINYPASLAAFYTRDSKLHDYKVGEILKQPDPTDLTQTATELIQAQKSPVKKKNHKNSKNWGGGLLP